MPPPSFSCLSCGHLGLPNDGIEANDFDPSDGRLFVACEMCSARHLVGITVLPEGRFVEIGRLHPEDVK